MMTFRCYSCRKLFDAEESRNMLCPTCAVVAAERQESRTSTALFRRTVVVLLGLILASLLVWRYL